MTNNFRSVIQSEAFAKAMDALHRDYYEEWRRERDPLARDRIAARADALDDVVAVLNLLATGDSDDAD
jgi:hypothetical protein